MRKKIIIFSIGLVTVCISAIAVIWFIYIKPPSDNKLIGMLFNQKLPGYSNITKLDGKGKGRMDDPRLLTLRVTMITGLKPVSCEGKLTYLLGDPSYLGYQWNTIDCIGHQMLVGNAQQALKEAIWVPPYKCYQDKTAALLAFWVQSRMISVEKIMDQDLQAMVRNILKEAKPLPDQITLIDLSRMRTWYLDPSLPMEQKMAEYVLRCDGSVDQYFGKQYTTIHSQVTLGAGDTYLYPPLEKP